MKISLVSEYKYKTKMCLSKNIIFIFLLCICTSKFGLGEKRPVKKGRPGHVDCRIEMPMYDAGYMPVPFEGNFTETDEFNFYETNSALNPPPSNPKLIRPDEYGIMFFKHNSSYRFTCTENEFIPPIPYPVSEIAVKCFNGAFVYKGISYDFSQLRCSGIPKARLIPTQRACQGGEHNEIIKVGIQSKDVFINLYRICFDSWHKNSVYSWYFTKPPTYEYTQFSNVTPQYIKTREYSPIEADEAYADQKKTMKHILSRDDILPLYKSNDSRITFINPGHLIGEHEFIYNAERHSTYFYENTAPQWFTFSRDVWNTLQIGFRRNLAHTHTPHLVVTGTILTNPRYHNTYDHDYHEMFLILPASLSVPEFFWKMDYDLESKTGIVFIGVNSPFKKIDPRIHFCDPIPCPGPDMVLLEKRTKLFYCCTKEAFEETYGAIDSVVFQQF